METPPPPPPTLLHQPSHAGCASVEFEIECLKIHATPTPDGSGGGVKVPHERDVEYTDKAGALRRPASQMSSESLVEAAASAGSAVVAAAANTQTQVSTGS